MADKMYAVEVELKTKIGKGRHAVPKRVRVWGEGEAEVLGQREDAVLRFLETQFQVRSGLPVERIEPRRIRAIRLVETDAAGNTVREDERWDNSGQEAA